MFIRGTSRRFSIILPVIHTNTTKVLRSMRENEEKDAKSLEAEKMSNMEKQTFEPWVIVIVR